MLRVLLVTQESRLPQILGPVFDRDGIQLETAAEWEIAQARLFRERYDLVAVDYEAVKLEDLDTFITLDNILTKERTVAVMMTRSKSERIKQLEEQLSAFDEVIDMSQGKPVFLRSMTLAIKKAREVAATRLSTSTLETDAISQVEMDLPVRESGTLRNSELARLAYTLRIRKESGRLTLENGPRQMVFGLSQGQILDGGDGFASAADFAEAFAWHDGEFTFRAGETPDGETVETVDLILRGVQKYKHQRDLTETLIDSMSIIPVHTNLWEERKERFSNYGVLNALVRLCDGKTTLERALAALGSMVNEGFRAAFFALQTDLLIPQPDENATAAVILYSREVRQQRQKIADSERQSTKAFRAASSDAGAREVASELKERTRVFADATPHEIFGVWEGCGRRVVQDAFYRLVKEHHPDVYGGNISDEMKGLAQEIFIMVKDAYQALLRVEKEQTVPPPDSFTKKVEQKEDAGRPRARSLAGGPVPPVSGLEEPSNSFTRSPSQETDGSNRPLHQTPQARRRPSPAGRETTTEPVRPVADSKRTSSATGRRTTSSGGAEEPDEKLDVKERLKKMSTFKKRRRRLTSSNSRTLSENSEPVQELLDKISETSNARNVETSEPEELTEEDERQNKLDRLLRKASQVDGPNAPNPARDAFNRGYRHFKADELEAALKQFSLARRFTDDGLYDTFYAYTLYKLDHGKAAEAIELLEGVIQSKHRQAAADAHLFLAHILKEGGNHERAMRHYKDALRLNPKSREAEREVRLAKMRGGGSENSKDDADSFLKKMFKK